MYRDHIDDTIAELDTLIARCRAALDRNQLDKQHASTFPTLRNLLHEIHQAIHLFNKHKGERFSLESCIAIFSGVVQGLPEVLTSLEKDLAKEFQGSLYEEYGLMRSSASNKPKVLLEIVEKLEYFNLGLEVVAQSVTRYVRP
jgi:hypothetical protein